MVTINGCKFWEVPTSCGTCEFFYNGATYVPGLPSTHQARGHCRLFNEMHHSWINIPRRCSKLFKKAFALYDNSGEEVVIVTKQEETD